MTSLFVDLLKVMGRLRKACPWDRKQTPQSIRRYLLLEAYEAFEAIKEKNWDSAKEELGDLLFQIVFHSHLAEEAGRFNIEDVLDAIKTKLISRHPHIFGDTKIRNAKEQIKKWEEYKSKENRKSLLDRVPKGMSALLQSYELQERAYRIGFTWKNINGVNQKLREEFREWSQARKSGSKKHMEDELGDLLFTLTNMARWLKLNPEEALLSANKKFRQRAAKLQQLLDQRKVKMQDCTEKELEVLWNLSKKRRLNGS